ncbi:MAG: metalloregulator ArsR/SmtB family transcription factor [Actinomycetota bacterium]|nr:metalloregulator ArsR/SmtB family transcription factor [Actinomycetota bacterium]
MSLSALDASPTEFLQLVADPHRWQLLRELARSDRRVGELTELLGRPQNLVSYHLAELRDAGLVTARRSSADRRDVYYRVDLSRCRDLLGAVGTALHPGLRLPRASPEPVPRPRGRAPHVLFLCSGNSARSQMAEALLEHRSGHTIRARSAGSHPKTLHPNAIRVMAERGIDISGRETKDLRRFARARFDRVITLCDKVREICPDFPGPPITAHWSMPDPSAEGGTDAGSYPAFRRTAEELEVRIGLLIGELAPQPTERRPHAR